MAACLAILIVGATLASNLTNRTPVQSELPIDGTSAIEECTSLEELSTKVGFPVEGLSDLPFEAQQTTYTSYWGELAQIEYSGTDGQTALYRKSLGTDDNSGNYDSFENALQMTIDGIDVTIKGSGENYSLAWWTDGTYAYSVCLSESASQTAWKAIIR